MSSKELQKAIEEGRDDAARDMLAEGMGLSEDELNEGVNLTPDVRNLKGGLLMYKKDIKSFRNNIEYNLTGRGARSDVSDKPVYNSGQKRAMESLLKLARDLEDKIDDAIEFVDDIAKEAKRV